MSPPRKSRTLSDPEVIAHFAAKRRNERYLVALYLLTVADIRGTSPKVWNAWKGKLLEDLFWATERVLRRRRLRDRHDPYAAQGRGAAKLRLYAIGEGAENALWDKLDTAYFLRHDPQEIAWHTRLLFFRANTPSRW